MTIYYSPNQKKSEDFPDPDFFVVLETEKKDRKSWVVWHEDGKYPNVIVEILSNSTAAVDKGFKKQLYQDTSRTPDYFWFDPVTLEFQGFHLVDGQYQEITPTTEGWLWSQELGLYLGVDEGKLRYLTAERQLIPSPEERVEQEHAPNKPRNAPNKQSKKLPDCGRYYGHGGLSLIIFDGMRILLSRI